MKNEGENIIKDFLEKKRERLLINLQTEKDMKIQKIKSDIMIKENRVNEEENRIKI